MANGKKSPKKATCAMKPKRKIYPICIVAVEPPCPACRCDYIAIADNSANYRKESDRCLSCGWPWARWEEKPPRWFMSLRTIWRENFP